MIALSPEWDHWFDEAFADLVTGDDDLVQAEFAAIISRWPPSLASDEQPRPESDRDRR
jgi:hypothetical protein